MVSLTNLPKEKSHHKSIEMFFAVAALFAIWQAVEGGVVPAPAAVVPAPARFVAAPAAAPLLTSAPAPLIAAPAPLAAYAKAVPQTVAPFASSVNFVARAPFLPYTAVASPVAPIAPVAPVAPIGSPLVETFSAPLVARKFAPVAAAAPLIAAPAPFVF